MTLGVPLSVALKLRAAVAELTAAQYVAVCLGSLGTAAETDRELLTGVCSLVSPEQAALIRAAALAILESLPIPDAEQ